MAGIPAGGPVVASPEEITGAWLGPALGLADLRVLAVDRIGTGQMSRTFRVAYEDDGVPGTVVVKLASDDPGSLEAATRLGIYEREVDYYVLAADKVAGQVPRCHVAAHDPGSGLFTVVLADQSQARQGDQIAGCSPEVAAHAMRVAARLHAPFFNTFSYGVLPAFQLANPRKQEYLSSLLPDFLDRFGDYIPPEHAEVYRRFMPSCDAWLADRRPPCSLVHLDFRLDNMLFDEGGGCTVVDWQTVAWGPVMTDVAYFLGSGLSAADRRAHERDLIRIYHDELTSLGIRNFSLDQAWEEYRRQVFHGLVMLVGPAMLATRTDRGDLMFRTLSERFCQQILDLESLELLDSSGTSTGSGMLSSRDEGPHEPTDDLLWNESWYFDVVSDDESLGLYVRMGNLPNQASCMYTAAIVRPGQPSILITDFAAPTASLELDRQVVHGAGLVADQGSIDPFQRYRVQLTGTGQAHADEADSLHGIAGDPVDVAFDLVWQTDGVVYPWRNSTRYEIPCAVTGTVTIGQEVIPVSGPGQRDHSWGRRDWWASDWMWCAFRLDDGNRLHMATVPTMPGFAAGYLQVDGRLTEITSGSSSCEVADDGLVISARLDCPDLGLGGQMRPLAFGALRLESPDGRLSFFPRCMTTLHLDDGRTGVGWVEWKHNQPASSTPVPSG